MISQKKDSKRGNYFWNKNMRLKSDNIIKAIPDKLENMKRIFPSCISASNLQSYYYSNEHLCLSVTSTCGAVWLTFVVQSTGTCGTVWPALVAQCKPALLAKCDWHLWRSATGTCAAVYLHLWPSVLGTCSAVWLALGARFHQHFGAVCKGATHSVEYWEDFGGLGLIIPRSN